MNSLRRHTTLSLRSNTYASIMCSFLIAIVLVFAALVYTTRANVVASELRAANDQARRLHDTVQHELESLDALAFDWARWNEAFVDTTGSGGDIARDRMQDSWNDAANVHLVLVADDEGRVLFSWEDASFPAERFVRSDVLEAPPDSSGFMVSGPLVMMVSSQPVPSGADGESGRRFVFGRLLDLKEAARLAGIDGAPSVMTSGDLPDGLTPVSPTRAKLTRPHNLTVYSLIRQPSGRAAGMIAAPVSSVG